jgi:hypothetical protein
LGFLAPNVTENIISAYLSEKELRNIQKKLNPILWNALLHDKSIFYKFCLASNIPIPELFAIFFKFNAGWSGKGHTLKTKQDWIRFFEKDIPPEFVIKPALGGWGREITIFNRSQKIFNVANGKSHTSEDIYNTVLLGSKFNYDCYVIQERLKNHPDLIQFTKSEALQTIRMITLIDKLDQPKILYASQKFALGDNIIDNQGSGTLGNIVAKVSENGILQPAVTRVPNEPGLKRINKHPQTGLSFEEFRVPFWNDACKFIKDVAIKFLPIRFVGWDVAITSDGPVLIEGQIFFESLRFKLKWISEFI